LAIRILAAFIPQRIIFINTHPSSLTPHSSLLIPQLQPFRIAELHFSSRDSPPDPLRGGDPQTPWEGATPKPPGRGQPPDPLRGG